MAKTEKKRFVDPRFARNKEYRKVIRTIAAENKCPFCRRRLKYHKKPILRKSGDWFITENSWSYKEAKHRFLIICRKHKERLSDLTIKDLVSVLFLANWAVGKFKLGGGALAVRFGDTRFTGATVRHLHFHLITPRISRKGMAKTVNFPIG